MTRERLGVGEPSKVKVTDLRENPVKRRTGEIVLADGYRARGRVRDRTGKMREVSVIRDTKGKAEREAQRRLKRLAGQIRAGATGDGPRTVSDLAAEWLAMRGRGAGTPPVPSRRKKLAPRRLAAGTLASYESVIRRVIVVRFGGLHLEDLTVPMLDSALAELDDVMSTREARTVLNQMLGWAVQQGWTTSNPMPAVSSPMRDGYEVEALSKKQVRRLLLLARRDVDQPRRSASGRKLGGRRPNRDLADVCTFALGTGARIGEILAVRIRDLDLDATVPAVTVCGTIVEPRGDFIPTRFRQPYPKGKSARKVPLPDAVVAMLRERLAGSAFTGQDDPVFASEVGTWLWASNIRTRLRDLVKDDPDLAGTSPHTLRRTVGTRIYKGPGGLQDACDLLGHSPGGVTFRHYVAERRVNPRVRKRLNAFFKDLDGL